jgi:serine/threonine protein kinase
VNDGHQVRVLGVGATADVRLVRHRRTQKYCALKAIKKRFVFKKDAEKTLQNVRCVVQVGV